MAASRLARGAPALALALFVAAALFHPACADEEAAYITACRQRCMVARGQETFRRGDQQACASQEHALPKPAVHTQCRQAYAMGRDRAAEKLCVLMCEYPQLGCDHSLSNEPSLKAELDAACAGPRRRRPTPGMGIACDTGFRGSLIRLCEVARKAEEPYLKDRELAQDRERELREAQEREEEVTKLQTSEQADKRASAAAAAEAQADAAIEAAAAARAAAAREAADAAEADEV